MANIIVKLVDPRNNETYYTIWSTNTDSPIEYLIKSKEVPKRYRKHLSAIQIKRLTFLGTSSIFYSLTSLLDLNRAGDNDSKISIEQIIDEYKIT